MWRVGVDKRNHWNAHFRRLGDGLRVELGIDDEEEVNFLVVRQIWVCQSAWNKSASKRLAANEFTEHLHRLKAIRPCCVNQDSLWPIPSDEFRRYLQHLINFLYIK